MRIGTCTECGRSFTHDKVKGFLPKRCKPCFQRYSADRQLRWRHANPERDKVLRDRAWAKRAANPEYLKEKRERETRRLYGLEPEDVTRLLTEQDGRCAICTKPPSGKSNGRARPGHEPRLHVDHCHTTNRVRGLLCGNCNTMIGLAAEDPRVLLAAVEYLSKE